MFYLYYVSMYVATVPNRKSPPAILLRESYRQDGKVKTRTLANISHLAFQQIAALRSALDGSLAAPATPLPDSFHISRSLPHGHVAAVLGSYATCNWIPYSTLFPAASVTSSSP